MDLFAASSSSSSSLTNKNKNKKRGTSASPAASSETSVKKQKKQLVEEEEEEEENPNDGSAVLTFEELGLRRWLCESCSAMGLTWPTPIQVACVPRLLKPDDKQRDLLALAETGSGKTAAFALPLLQRLFEDPYGVFCLVLSPSRELALQIADQFAALGSRANVKVCTVIGGQDSTKQGNELHNTRPHVVVATPGRLAELLRYSVELRSHFSRLDTLVLDEADRLLSDSMAPDMQEILDALPAPPGEASEKKRRRTTLFFSATHSEVLAASLKRPEFCSKRETVDLSTVAAVPPSLTQEYIFMPNRVKISYFVGLLKALGVQSSDDVTARLAKTNKKKKAKIENKEEERLGTKVESCIIFVQTCKRAHELHSLLLTLGVKALTLHSKLGQKRRLAALAKFKSKLSQLLVCTDVASRGLDIPSVELVVNYDLPRVPDDYIHRVGRTARAGKLGRAVSLVTQRDLELLHKIEARIDSKLTLCPELEEKDVLALLNPVGKAMIDAQKRYPWTHDDPSKTHKPDNYKKPDGDAR